ncbi:MAG: hypothetical protein HY961_12105 [Ignavibacteriae bacterium]|nr:hypothetical protein [Ignavibacteriota bacterium]
MAKSKRVVRRLILSKLYDLLADQYSIMYPREPFVGGDLSVHELDALLAFRSDPRLEELRQALDRLENGTYGICLSCKSAISHDELDTDPAQRLCSTCEQKLMHVPMPSYYHSATL